MQLQQAATAACIEAATACIEAVRPLEVVAAADSAVPAAVVSIEDTAHNVGVSQSSPDSVGATVNHVSPEAPPAIEHPAVEPPYIENAPHIETAPHAEPATPIEPAPHIEQAPIIEEAAMGAKASNIKILHPGIEGSSSVHVECSEEKQAAMITVRAEVRVTPCTTAVDGECVPMPANHASMDVAAAFASSIAAQAAVSCSKYVTLPAFLLLLCTARDDANAFFFSIATGSYLCVTICGWL